MKVLIFAAFFQGATSMCWAQQTGSTDEYHRGYLWAHMHHVDNTSTCDGVSKSFGEGCIAFVADKRVAMSEDGASTVSYSENPALRDRLHDRKDACVASIRLEQASTRLARCARSIEVSDGCVSEYRRVREAFNRYSDMSRSTGEACK